MRGLLTGWKAKVRGLRQEAWSLLAIGPEAPQGRTEVPVPDDLGLGDGPSGDRALPALDPVSPKSPLSRRAHFPSPRGALVVAWTLAFAGLGTGVALSFERLFVSLTEAPSPSWQETMPSLSTAARSEDAALHSARRLMAEGDFAAALRILDSISPDEPSYPLARELRAQAEVALRGAEGSS
jgi:hypothetical protein